MRKSKVVACSLLLAALGCSRSSPPVPRKPATPEELTAQIEAIKAPKVAWRGIAWKSCLLEGLKESRAKGKPILIWMFIERPIDDERC
jgi:hypothetical protein